mmetsp:Transcript_42568/g.97614  ORF Transcript_42568/g.97614 Transcript_42568/m.97614 type:complete len:485 (+) Transcript_42568:70-1524(+)
MPKKLLHVSGLSKKTTPEEFAEYFSYYGDLLADLKRDADTGQSLCYGFLDFNEESSAKQALADAKKHVLGSKALQVRVATPAEVAQEKQDLDEVDAYEDGEDAQLAPEPVPQTKKRKYEKPDFEEFESAAADTDVVPPWKTSRTAGIAEAETQKKGQKSRVSLRLWVGNIPKKTRDAELASYFSRFGVLYDVYLNHDMLNSQKLWAFITFQKPSSAKNALSKAEHKLHGEVLQVAEAKVGALTITGFGANASEEELQAHFARHGTIEEFYIEGEGASRSAYLKYESSCDSQAVLIKKHDLRGKMLTVRQCKKEAPQQKKKLYVGPKLSPDTTEASIAEYFSWYGTVQEVSIPKDDAGNPRGFALLSFEDELSAELALDGAERHVIDGVSVNLRKWQKKGQAEAKVLVQGLLPSTQEAVLSCYFSHFGALKSVELKVDRKTLKSKGMGVVTFDEVSSVQHVLGNRGHKIDGKVVQVLPFTAKGQA